MISKGQRYFHSDSFQQCVDVLGAVLETDPGNLEALRLCGLSLLKLARPREAIGLLRRAARDQSAPIDVLIGLAGAFEDTNRLVASELVLRQAVRRHPQSLALQERRARLLVRLRRGAPAEAAARAALYLSNGRSVSGRLSLGCALFLQRQLELADRELTLLARGRSADGVVLAVLGRVREWRGDFSAAARILRKAAEILPLDARMAIRIARCLAAADDYPGCEFWLAQALPLAVERPGQLVTIARIHLGRGDYHAALRAAGAAAALTPDATNINLVMGRCYLALDNPALAERHLSIALAQAVSVEALTARAEALVALGKQTQAEADLRQVIELSPNNSEARLNLGVLLSALERPREAVPYLNCALEDGASAAAAFALGKACFQSGDFQAARAALEVAHGRDKDLAGLKTWLSRATMAGKVDTGNSPFCFREGISKATRKVSLMEVLHKHLAVVNALVQRQTRVKFGRHRLGYVMAVVGPLLSITLMLVILTTIRHRQPGGMSLPLFLMTGLMMWGTFLSCWDEMESASRVCRQLLAFPRITPINVRISLVVFSFYTHMLVMLILGLGFYFLGEDVGVDRPLQIIGAFGIMMLLGTGFGMIMEVAMSYWKSVLKLAMRALRRVLFLTSGIFFSVQDLPPGIRKYALMNPLVHVIEYARNGAESSFPLHGTDIHYAVGIGAVMLMMGLVLEARHRARLLRK